MRLERENHKDLEHASRDIKNLSLGKQDAITFSTRAPTAGDEGRFWVKYTKNDSTVMTFYIRHPDNGTWMNVNVAP